MIDALLAAGIYLGVGGVYEDINYRSEWEIGE